MTQKSILARRNIAKTLLGATAGRFISVTFIKKDGSERTLSIQPHAVKTHLAENPSESAKKATETRKANNPHLFPVYDVQAKCIKSINLDTITRIKMEGMIYEISET